MPFIFCSICIVEALIYRTLLFIFSVMQVGNAFVNQYYNVLHQSPQVVHRFYTDASHMTRAEAGAGGAVDVAHTQDVSIIWKLLCTT